MRRHHYLALILFLLSYVQVSCQDNAPYDFKQADSLIQFLSEEADFVALSQKLNQHLDEIEKLGLQDSLYKYTYLYGRALTETKGLEAGIKATEEFVSRVIESDSNKSHQLSALSDLSWIYIEAGEDSMVLETDLRYLKLVNNYPDASPREKYMAHYALGFDYEFAGKSHDAIEEFKKAIAAVKVDSIAYITELMDGHNGLGAAYWRNGELIKAKKAFLRSNDLSVYYKDTISALMYQANAIGNLSLVYEDEGNLVKSKDMLELSLKKRKDALSKIKDLYQKDQQTRHLIRNYHNLAALYLNLGDLERARRMTAYCEDLRKENLPPDHPDHAKAYEAYGGIAFAQGDYDQALKQYQRSLDWFREVQGENSYLVMEDYQRIGKTYLELRKYDLAVENLTKSIRVAKELSEDNLSQSLAKTYMLRARAFAEQNNHQSAENDLRSAESIFRNTRESNNYIFGILYLEMASLKMKLDNADSAGYYIDQALSIGENGGGSIDKFNASLKFLPKAYQLKAELLSQKGDQNSLKQAFQAALEAKDLIKEVRIDYEEELSQLAFYEQQADIFDNSIDLAVELYKLSQDQNYLEAIHNLAEESKTILLRQRLNKFTSLRVSNIPDSLLANENYLLSVIAGKIPSSPEDVLDAEKRYLELIDFLKSNYPAYYQLRYEESISSIDDIQKNLISDGQNIIELILTKGGAYSLVITTEKVQFKELRLDGIENVLGSYNRFITEQNDSLAAASHELYNAIIAPVEPYLTGSEIIVIPDNGVFNINFETFTKDQSGKDFLIYHYQFSYLLSATTALKFRELNLESKKGLVAFAPGFTEEMKNAYRQNLVDSLYIDEAYLSSIQQPFSIITANKIASSFSGKALVTSEATEKNFKDLADEYAIIHLGTHTEINNISPLLSRFILTKPGDSPDDQEDGYLHAYEIYNMPLRAELAVLTACETGIGKETSSEGVLSIAHSFAYAGCPSIIMSIWQIDEKTSANIIGSFYDYLKDGEKKDQALRNAKLHYLSENSGELQHPYYWSGLVLVGNTDSIEMRSSFFEKFARVLIVILGLTLVVFLYRRFSKES